VWKYSLIFYENEKRKYRMTRAFTTSQFIIKAIRVHGDKYDYSKTYYVNNRTEVTIICAVHGRFYQLPRVHFSGHGCSRCGANTSREDLRKTKSKFIQEAFQVHGVHMITQKWNI